MDNFAIQQPYKGYVIVIERVCIMRSDKDSIYRPGEWMVAEVEIKQLTASGNLETKKILKPAGYFPTKAEAEEHAIKFAERYINGLPPTKMTRSKNKS